MLLGAYFWGCSADMHGRKKTLIASLLMDGLFSMLSSFLTFFWPFLLCRFFSGFGSVKQFTRNIHSIPSSERLHLLNRRKWNMSIYLHECWMKSNSLSIVIHRVGAKIPNAITPQEKNADWWLFHTITHILRNNVYG